MSLTTNLNSHRKLKPMTDVYKKMSVADYAKLRGLQPQLVHYYIRKGELVPVKCECCGGKVIDVKEADVVMRKKK